MAKKVPLLSALLLSLSVLILAALIAGHGGCHAVIRHAGRHGAAWADRLRSTFPACLRGCPGDAQPAPAPPAVPDTEAAPEDAGAPSAGRPPAESTPQPAPVPPQPADCPAAQPPDETPPRGDDDTDSPPPAADTATEPTPPRTEGPAAEADTGCGGEVPPAAEVPPPEAARVGDAVLTRDALERLLAARLPADADAGTRAALARDLVAAFVRDAVIARALEATPPTVLPCDRVEALTALERTAGGSVADRLAGDGAETAQTRFDLACRVAALVREQAPAFAEVSGEDFAQARAEADDAHRRACDAVRAEMEDYARRITGHTATVEALANAFSDVREIRSYPLDKIPDAVREALETTPTGSVSPIREVPGGLAMFKVLARTDPEARRAEAETLRGRLLAGESFSALAAEVSDCPSGKDTGGALGTLRRGTMFPEFEEAAFTLPLGTLSPVIRTEAGFHILKVTARDPDAGTAEVFHILIGAVPTVRAVTLARKYPDPTPDSTLRERLRKADAGNARARYIRSLLDAPDISVAPEFR